MRGTVPEPRRISIKIKKKRGRDVTGDAENERWAKQRRREKERKKRGESSEGFLAVRRRAAEGIPRRDRKSVV